MILRFLIFIFLFIFLSNNARAQFNDMIRTGRPGQSFEPFTVGKKVLQFQSGITYFDSEFESIKTTGISENLLIRYGIAERIEFNAVVSYSSDEINETVRAEGINQLDAGFRINLFERPSGFSGSWQNRIKLNTVDEDFQAENTGFVSAFSLGYPALGGGFTFNGGVLWDGNNNGALFFYTFNYTHILSEKWILFLEPYGNYFNEWNIFIDGGIGFLINKDFQLDASVGIDIDDRRELFFVDAGFSYRILALR